MDSERAREIMMTPEPIKVLYNGSPVWLDNILDGSSVEIMNLKDQSRQIVPVNDLEEEK